MLEIAMNKPVIRGVLASQIFIFNSKVYHSGRRDNRGLMPLLLFPSVQFYCRQLTKENKKNILCASVTVMGSGVQEVVLK